MLVRFLYAAMIAAAALQLAPAAAQDETADEFALSSGGDAGKGKRVFFRCRACHNLTADARPKIGPNLDNLFGRRAGTSETFTRYSKALLDAGFVWTEQKLNEWLMNPKTFLPGNKMAFAGVNKEQDRKDLLAYLREATTAEPAAAGQ